MAKGKYQEWLTPDGLLLLEAWARNGLTDEQIAANMGVTRATLYNWKTKYVDVFNALKKGKEVVDIQVENALFKRAIGYSYTETTKERVAEYDTETGEALGSHMETTKEVTKEIAGDVTAQIFWLKNRKPEAWRDVKNIDANVKTETMGLTNDQLDSLILQLEGTLGVSGNE